MPFYVPIVYGDLHARKSTHAKKALAEKTPQCLVRANHAPDGHSISTVVGPESCDLFQKRVSQIFKASILRSKPSKHRTSSQ